MWVKGESEIHYFLNMGLSFIFSLASLKAFMPVASWKQYCICTPSLQHLTHTFLRTELVEADNITKYT